MHQRTVYEPLHCEDQDVQKSRPRPDGDNTAWANLEISPTQDDGGTNNYGKSEVAANAPKPGAGDDNLLKHLGGARFIYSVWILCDHFIHRSCKFCDRANVAVSGFITMSGFVTHWAYQSRQLDTRPVIMQYYVRRVGRVVLTTFFAEGVSTALEAFIAMPSTFGHMVRCFLFIEPWYDPVLWCPNGQTWTIACLMPSWLLYPFTKRVVAYVEKKHGTRGLGLLAIGLYITSFGPTLVTFILQGGYIDPNQHNVSYVWPPSQLADFLIGMVAAALAKSNAGLTPALRGALADISVLIMLIFIFAVPSTGYHQGIDSLFNHALVPAIAFFYYGSAAQGGAGIVAWLLSRSPMVKIGKYSFEVFLFQSPLFTMWETVFLGGLNELVPVGFVAALFMVSLFAASAAYGEYIDIPFAKWLKQVSAKWV